MRFGEVLLLQCYHIIQGMEAWRERLKERERESERERERVRVRERDGDGDGT